MGSVPYLEAVLDTQTGLGGAGLTLINGIFSYPPFGTHSTFFLGPSLLSSVGDFTGKVLPWYDSCGLASRSTGAPLFLVPKNECLYDCFLEL